MKISVKFMMTISAILILGAVLMMSWIYYSSYRSTLNQAIRDDTALSDLLHEAVYGFMSTGQQEHLDAYLEKVRQYKSISEIRVIRSEALQKELGIKENARVRDDLDRQALVTGREADREVTVGHARAIRRVTPVLAGKSCLTCHTSLKEGDVIAALSTTLVFQSSLDEMVQNLVRTGLLQGMLILFVIGVIFMMFHRLIMRPVMAIRTFVKKVGSGDLSAIINIKSKGTRASPFPKGSAAAIDSQDEIGELAVAFNDMSKDLQKTTVSLEALNKEVLERKKAEEATRESEEKFRMIFERSAVAIMLADENERLISWNKFVEDLLGLGPEDLAMKPLSSLYPPEEWQKIRSLNIRKLGMIEHLETAMIRKGGGRVDVDISVSIIDDGHGNITGSIWIARNISDRKRVEEAAEALSIRNKVLLQTGSDGIHVVDYEGNVIEANDAFCQMLGYTREEMLHLNVADWDAQWTAEEAVTKVRQLMNTSRVFETRHRSKDGKIHEVEISARGVTLENRPYLYASVRDISERKERGEREKKHLRELEIFYKASIGREARIIGLKKEIESLQKKLKAYEDSK